MVNFVRSEETITNTISKYLDTNIDNVDKTMELLVTMEWFMIILRLIMKKR